MLFSDFSSFLFNLTVFTGLAVLLALYLLNSSARFNKKALYTVFMGLGIFAILTQLSYVFAPTRIFSNASHHIIENLGFSFERSLALVNSEKPESALWDAKSGKLGLQYQRINEFVLHGEDFFEPVFVLKDEDYHLANPVFAEPVNQSLSIVFSDSLAFEFKVFKDIDDVENYSFSTKVKGKKYGPFQINRKELKTGYRLSGLLAETQTETPEMAQLMSKLDSTWIIRSRYNPNNTLSISENPLHFFPSHNLLSTAKAILIDGKKIENLKKFEFDISLKNANLISRKFYIGLWSTRNKVYTVQCKNDQSGLCELNPVYSDKKQLKKLEKQEESLFLTSSSEDVASSDLMAGFYYPIFKEENNQNHFSATLAYHEGNTKQQMKFRVVSVDKNDLLIENTRLYNAGDTIRLETIGATKGLNRNFSLFRIKNLKAENPLQFWHLISFTVLLIFCIYVSLYLTPKEKLTKTEVLAYLLIVVLMTVRSILLWRVSTFPPLEDISEKVFDSLINTGFENFRRGVYATIIFFFLVWVWKIWGDRLVMKFVKLKSKEVVGISYKNALLILFYSFGFVVQVGNERVGAIYFPLILFFLLEFYFLFLTRNAERTTTHYVNFRTLSILNWVTCFGYLALSDAGFSIVFTISSLIYWLIRLLVFPDQQFSGGTSGRFRHWRFIMPFILLLIILIFSPYLISEFFRNSKFIVFFLAGLLVGFAIFIQFNKSLIWENNPKIAWFLSGLLLTISLGFFVFQKQINQKIEDKTYIRYRAEVLIHSADEIIQKEEFKFNLGNDSKLLRAAQNQWIINHYYGKGNLGIYNYFRLLPGFQKGSPHLTQISDLVTVRYLIGEHSQFVVIQLLFLMIVLIFSALSSDTRFNLYSKMRVQILCLLFTVGFFIWLAATNRMVFLGQDFPLLSLNSFLTLLFTFTILFSAIALGQLANADEGKLMVFNSFGKKIAYNLVRLTLLLGSVLLFTRQYDLNSRKFDLDTTIRQLQSSFEPINERFAEYQQEHTDSLKIRPDSVSTLLAGFDTFIQQDKDSLFKSNFSRSAYEAYRKKLSTQNSGDNLVHLRRGSDGIYSFGVNKLYYNVYSPDVYEQVWRGNILAAQNTKSYSLQNRNSRKNYDVNIDRNDSDFGGTLDRANFTKMKENLNLRLTILPAGWTRDTLPAIIISKTGGSMRENQSGFIVKNGIDIFRSKDVERAMVLQPNDVVQFVPAGESQPVTFQYKHKNARYVARNIWLNGRNQFYYPLGEKFLWSYYFTNLVKNKFDKEPEDKNRNVELTIDEELTSQIYDLAHTYFKKNKWRSRDSTIYEVEKARAFNLVVLDDQGRIRALSDFKKGASVKINPNKMSEYTSLQDEQYLSSDVDQERTLFGNRCLMRMDNGPASTFKPIMYGAITSQFNFNWSALEFGGVPGSILGGKANDDYTLRRFGGRRGVKFTVGSNNVQAHDMEYYISKSTNTYNSMIVFLGSLDKSQISKVLDYTNGQDQNATFLLRGPSKDSLNTFPNFVISGESYLINQFPKSWSNYNSLMSTGLWENFDMPIRKEQLNGNAGQRIQNLAVNLDSTEFDASRSTYKLWSFPEPSHLFMIDRLDLHTAIVQLATGASPINTTPLKMAEMAGKLFSFNREYKAAVVEGKTTPYHPLSADGSWNSAQQLTAFYSKNLFKAMNKALLPGGTANVLVGQKLVSEFSQYSFYAKTGTISGNREQGKRDKHLMLIISKNRLHDRDLTPEDLKNNKFYVLYFSFYKQSVDSNWGDGIPVLQNMVRTVVNSSGFKTYMR